MPCLAGRIVGTRPQPLALLHGGFLVPQLVTSGLLSRTEAAALDEVFQFNPLLFDLVLKLSVRHPRTGTRLPPELFGEHPQLPPWSGRRAGDSDSSGAGGRSTSGGAAGSLW